MNLFFFLLYCVYYIYVRYTKTTKTKITKTWMAFWSDDSSIKFFNISCMDLSKALSYAENNNNNNDVIGDIDDLLFEEKDEEDDNNNDNNSIFTIDENEDLNLLEMNENDKTDKTDKNDKNDKNNKKDKDKDKDKEFDEEDITDQTPLRVDSYLPSNDRSGIPIIRTINIGDELSDINKQLVFISDIIAWLKQQIIRIKSKLHSKKELTLNDQDTFNAIIICLRKLLLDSSAITSLCVSIPNIVENNKNEKISSNDIKSNGNDNDNENENKNDNDNDNNNDDKDDAQQTALRQSISNNTNTSSYLRMIIDIVRDLTDECCKSNKSECIHLFKSILADIASNPLTHHLVVQLLEVFVDRISNHQHKLDCFVTFCFFFLLYIFYNKMINKKYKMNIKKYSNE